jgi:FkbM family methyltransferase
LSDLLKKWPNSKLLRGICPGNILFSDSKIIVAQRDNLYFELNLSDYMDWLLYFYSETDSSKNVLNFVKEGDWVLDIGGNIGQTALFLSDKVRNNGMVISFEPFPKTYKRFERNLALNSKFKNIRLERIALGDKKSVLKMHSENKGNSGQNRISEDEKPLKDFFDVEVMTLNEYVKKNPLKKIDLIKIDVEGFEYKVLLGSDEIIKKFRPKLFIELSDKNLRQQGDNAKDLLKLLHEWGYQAINVNSGMVINTSTFDHIDIFCIPQSQN